MTRFSTLVAVVAVAIGVANGTPGARAATSGIAFDSVQKFSMGGDAQAQPGTFASDFAAASAPAGAPNGKRGFLGINNVIAAASGAMAMIKTGTAEHHYVAGAKSRVDTIASGEARIVDCTARTLTTLDLKKKTYTVVSLDVPETTETPAPRKRDRAATPEPTGTDDGTKVALAMTTKSLGARPIDGVATTGYDARMKMTTTRPSGESQSFDTAIVSYLSGYAEPRESCPEAASRLRTHAEGNESGAGMEQFALAMKAMKTPKGDPRFTVSNSGPTMPTGKLAMWQHMAIGEGGGFAILIERGNVHSIAENDPIFSVPADFTKKP